MSFRISSASKLYKKHINDNSKTGKFEMDFDYYYLCAILGMTKRKCSDDNKFEHELLRSFPSKYLPYRSIIVGIFLEAEKSRLGISDSDRKQLENFMIRFISPSSPTYLSDDAEEKLNCYSQAGYELLEEEIGRCTDLDEFLIQYLEIINDQDL